MNDADILEIARESAFDFAENEDITKHPVLNAKISQKIEEGLELIGAG